MLPISTTMSRFAARLALAASLAFVLVPTAAQAQHAHGGGGGWHGGGWHGGWGGGWHGGVHLGIGIYDPFFYDPYWYSPYYYGPPVVYAPPPAYGPPPYPPPSYGPSDYPPPDYAPPGQPSSAPGNNEPAFYSWPIGIQIGSCNRAYLAQVAGTSPLPAPNGRTPSVDIGGIPVGTLVGGSVGARMSVADQACVMQSLEFAKTGATVAWQGSPGLQFDAQPTRTFFRDGGQPCREYRTTAHARNRVEETSGTACRAPDGAWEPAEA